MYSSHAGLSSSPDLAADLAARLPQQSAGTAGSGRRLLRAVCVQVPPMSAAQTRQVMERELGGVPLERVFEWIDLDTPLGSASIAQARVQPAPPPPLSLPAVKGPPSAAVKARMLACPPADAACRPSRCLLSMGPIHASMQVHKGRLRLQQRRRRHRPRGMDLRLSLAAARRDDCTWRVGTGQDVLLGAAAAPPRQSAPEPAAPGGGARRAASGLDRTKLGAP